MEIDVIKGHTRVLGAPKDWDSPEVPVSALAICDVPHGGVNWMVSAWKPTAEELAHLNANGSVLLWIQGEMHPVVGISTNIVSG